MTDGTRARLDYVDNLRIFLTCLVVCHHQWIAFGAPGGWYYIVAQPNDLVSNVIMTLFVAVNQAYFMSLFFFVSAYFTPISLDKKGWRRFTRDRLLRLGAPLAAYFFVLNPSVVYLVRWFSGKTSVSYWRFMRDSAAGLFGTGPMWFVLALLIFTGVYIGIQAVARRSAARGATPFPGNFRILAFILLIGAATFFVRLLWPTGSEFMGLQLGYFPLYVCMFAFGIVAYRSSWLDQLSRRRANGWFIAAIAMILTLPITVLIAGPESAESSRGGMNWLAYTYAAWEPFLCVGISMKLLVLFRERFNKANSLTARLSKSAYTVYILHPFFVVAATGLMKDLAFPPLSLALAASAAVLVVAFACANVIRQAPVLNKVL